MRIAYITTYDATDKKNWSGLGYYIAEMLKSQGNDLVYFGNLPFKPSVLDKLKNRLRKVFKNSSYCDRSISVSKSYGNYFKGKLEEFDIIFSPGTISISFLETKRPIVFYTDAAYAGMINFYGRFSKLNKSCIKVGNLLEQRALDNCSLAIYASDWAAKTAKIHYKVTEDKIKVIPFGANLDTYPSINAVQKYINKRVSDSTCNLLFVGVDWKRKGGDKVVDVVKHMIAQGQKVKLHIVGTTEYVPDESFKNYIKNYGFLSKNNSHDNAILNQLYQSCHFFIMLPEAECYGLVYCEAGAHGLPSIATDTGGVGTIIKNNINGFLYDDKISAQEIANNVIIAFSNKNNYLSLSLSTYHLFKKELNWFATGRKVQQELMRIIHDFDLLDN